MSNGGSLLDSITGLFSSGGGGTESRGSTQDPVEARLERVEQVAEGVRMASAALEDDVKELRREAEEAAEQALEAARERAPEDGDAGPGEDGPSREAIGALDRCIEALEELHYRVVRVEAHPGVDSDEERERAAEQAMESVGRLREVADSMTETAKT
ncbi:MAG: hypothetical protein ABEJ00_01095 [Gemmatimonadota bacterium]